MSGHKRPLAIYLVMFIVVLVAVFLLAPVAFHRPGNYWYGAAALFVVMALPIVVYLCRPSVRKAFAAIFALSRGHRALARGDFDLARLSYCKALELAETMTVNHDSFMGNALMSLAELYRLQGRFGDAEPILQRAIMHFKEASPPLFRDLANARHVLAAVYINQGRYRDAEPLSRLSLEYFQNVLGPKRDHTIVAHLNLGQVLVGLSRLDAAESAIRTGYDLAAVPIERGRQIGGLALFGLADLRRRQGRLAEAEPLAQKAVAILGRTAARHPLHARAVGVLAEVLRQLNRPDEAERLCEQAQAQIERTLGADHFGLDFCRATLARIRIAQGNNAEAEQLLRRCLKILNSAVVPDHPDRLARMNELAALLRAMNCLAEADRLHAELKIIPVWCVEEVVAAE